jgi:hypothetical protein
MKGINEEFKKLNDRFEFLTYAEYAENEYIGIIQNSDSQFVSMYAYNRIFDKELKTKFLEYGEIWWWESNRKIPINMFLGSPFKIFSPYLFTFNSKEFNCLLGPKVCLDDMMEKRVKRRTVQLIKKIS